MTFRLRSVFLFLLYGFVFIDLSYSNNLKEQPVDSLISILHDINVPSERLEIILEIANKLNWIDKERALPYVDESIELARQLSDYEKLGHALLERYENLFTSISSDSLQYLRDEAEEAFKKANNQEGLALMLVDRALDAETSGDLSTSMNLYLESQEIFEVIGNELEYNANWVSIASLMNSMNRNDEALKYLQRAEEYTFSKGDDYAKGYYFMVQGRILEHENRMEEAKAATQEMLRIAIKNEFNNDIVSASTALGDMALETNDLDEAKEYYSQALEVAKILKGKFFTSYAQAGMGKYHLRMENYLDAKKIFLKARKILDEPAYGYYQNDVNRDLGLAYAGLNMSDSAYFFMHLYAAKQDSVHTNEAKRIATEIEAIYQNEKKEQQLLQGKRERNFLYTILSLGFIGIVTLIYAYREKIRSNKILSELNEQKEFLIKEIHHRVKNNLQIISSLLNLQSNVIDDEKAVSAVIDGRNRVQSMSLIHQKLYMGDHLAEVNMEEYIDDLSAHLLDSFGRRDDTVNISNRVDVPPLDVDTAIPLGLIINELITNCLKYGIPNGRSGKIKTSLKIDQNDHLVLTVEDNGVEEMVTEESKKGSTKFGANMVDVFSKKLKGKVNKAQTEKGYKTIIAFEKYNKA